jgi:hypothetical protein
LKKVILNRQTFNILRSVTLKYYINNHEKQEKVKHAEIKKIKNGVYAFSADKKNVTMFLDEKGAVIFNLRGIYE